MIFRRLQLNNFIADRKVLVKCIEVLRVQGARIGLEINVKKTFSLRLLMNGVEKMMLGKVKTDQADTITNLGSLINRDGGYSDM